MAGHAAATRDKLLEGARDIALGISTAARLDTEHIRKEIVGLSSRTGNIYSTASDAVHDQLKRLDGAKPDVVAAFERYFPTPKGGK